MSKEDLSWWVVCMIVVVAVAAFTLPIRTLMFLERSDKDCCPSGKPHKWGCREPWGRGNKNTCINCGCTIYQDE